MFFFFNSEILNVLEVRSQLLLLLLLVLGLMNTKTSFHLVACVFMSSTEIFFKHYAMNLLKNTFFFIFHSFFFEGEEIKNMKRRDKKLSKQEIPARITTRCDVQRW
jgi:hypothetical protein